MRLVPVVFLIIALIITSNDEFSAPYSFAEDKEIYIGVLKKTLMLDFRNIEELVRSLVKGPDYTILAYFILPIDPWNDLGCNLGCPEWGP
jgi:hypothetical protein